MSESYGVKNFFEKYKSIHIKVLDFLDDEENFGEDLNFFQIQDFQNDLKLFLHLLLEVSNNHHRSPNFFSKIERILRLYKEDIKQYSSQEIFNIFKSNKRILLFFIEEKIMTVDEYFVKQIINEKYFKRKYPQYFSPELKPYLNEEWFLNDYTLVKEMNKELPDNFFELRNEGENESFLCKLIREDSIIEFISHINRNNIPCNATIELSIYETNSFLIKKHIQSEKGIMLIEYAAFYGSIQIYQFLCFNNAKFGPNLWLFTIHGRNPEMIHLLEENKVELPNNSYIKCFDEAIKCNHNELADYFYENFVSIEKDLDQIFDSIVHYQNYSFLSSKALLKDNYEFIFYAACKYNQIDLVNLLLFDNEIKFNVCEI